MKPFLLALTCLFVSGYFIQTYGQTLPQGFSLSKIERVGPWTQPIAAAFNKDGKKLFVWEKAGKVWLFNWDATMQKYVQQADPVLDISPEVGDWRDFGLIGFALDPDFDNNGLVYLLYVVDRHYLMNFGTANYDPAKNEYFNATIGRITRYKTVTNGNAVTTDYNSRTILLGETKTTGIPILFESHGVGTLIFAADGTLLVSNGDGSSYNGDDVGSKPETYFQQAITDGIIRPEENVGAFRAQMINSLNGKILRIDPKTGNGISSNPFYDAANPRSAKSRVWAFGLRNPFRMSVKPNTGSTNPATGDIGEIYVGDVGLGAYEEINIINSAGQNCGWPIYEGFTYTLKNGPNDNSQYVAKSTTTENKDEPNPLYNSGGCTQQYFHFGDLLKEATADGNTTIYNPCSPTTPIASATPSRFVHHRPAIDWRHQEFNGDSARVGIFNGNVASFAQIGSPQSGVTGQPFHGNCTVGGTWYSPSSFPPEWSDGYFMADYVNSWIKFVKMKNAVEVQEVKSFTSDGFGLIIFLLQNPMDGSLIVVDYSESRGGVQVDRITYGGSQPPVAVATSDKKFGPSGLVVNFTGDQSKDPENGALTYSWDFGDGSALSTQMNPPAHTFTTNNNLPKKFVVKLTVKDNMNMTSTDSVIISINNTPPVVNIISPVKNSKYITNSPNVDTVYTLQATVTDAEQQDGDLKYAWQTILRHNTHEHAEAIDTNRITSSLISRVGCNGDTYYWLIRLTVTDAFGLSTSDSSKMFPLCEGDVVLAVELVSFSVNTQNNANVVKWTTKNEVNSSNYIVERSSSGQDFQPINQQQSNNLPGEQSYSFADDKYFPGTNYYRLKVIDVTGKSTYSQTIKVYNGAGTDDVLRITPNPVSKQFTLATSFPENGPVSIRIIDATGKVVRQISDNVTRGSITMQIYQLEELAAGTYFLEVKQKDYIRNTKFVKID